MKSRLYIFNKKEEEVIITSEKEDSYLNKEEIYKWLNLYDNKMVELNVENNDGNIIYNIDEDIDYLEKKGLTISKSSKIDEFKVVKVIYE